MQCSILMSISSLQRRVSQLVHLLAELRQVMANLDRMVLFDTSWRHRVLNLVFTVRQGWYGNDYPGLWTPGGVHINVLASVGGVPSLWSSVSVTAKMEDWNDNAPAFLQSSTVYVTTSQVADNDNTLVTLIASDPDTGEGGRMSYSIFPLPHHSRVICSISTLRLELAAHCIL